MAIAYRSHTAAQQLTDYTNLVLTKPVGLADRDVLLLLVHTRKRELGFETPAGFTQIGETFGFWHWHHWHGFEDRHKWNGTWWDVHDHHRHHRHHHWHYGHEPQGETAAYFKVIDNAATEPATYALVPKQGADDTYGIAVAYSGVSNDAPIVDSDFDVTHKRHSNRAVAGDVVVVKGGVSVAFATDYTMTQAWTTPSGFTERADTLGMALADRVFANSGYAGARSYFGTPTGDDCARWVQSCTVSLRPGNVAPNAPTLLSPVSGAVLNLEDEHRFLWQFSDDEGDTQAGYTFRYKLLTSTSWTTVSASSPSTFADVAADTFTAGDHEWQVSTTDQGGLTGPFSGSLTFTAVAPPAAPVINDPILDQTITDNAYQVTWSAASQDAFQLRLLADVAGAPDETDVLHDTGEVVDSVLRTHLAPFPDNGLTEHLQVRVRLNGLWSDWSSVRVSVSYTPPAAPTFVVNAFPAQGAIDFVVTNPAPSGGQPAVAYNEVWVDDGDGLTLRATNLPTNATWRYWTARSNVDYSRASVRVRAVAVNDSASWSEQV